VEEENEGVDRGGVLPAGSDCQGFQNPQGSGVGSVGVRVRVGIYVPLKNPYPWQGSRVSTRPKIVAYIDLKMVFFFYFSVQNFILKV